MVLIEMGLVILVIVLILEIVTYIIDNDVKKRKIKKRKR